MRLILISDTHGRYAPDLPDGNILIHAGDHSMEGTPGEMWNSIQWLGSYRERYEKIFVIAGNHDFFAESYPKTMRAMCEEHGLVYLQDEGYVYNHVYFWGSPVSPWFHDWAFGPHRGREIQRHWSMISEHTDVLITHGPPMNILDLCPGGNVGCEDLRDAVKRIKPQLHVFGHIHEGRGVYSDEHTDYVNASMLDDLYTPAGDAFTYDL